MNGTLSLESTTGRGTRFEIALPLSPCPPPHQPSAGGPAVDLSSLSVLVVEDNPINRRVVTTQLGKMEVGEVLVAEDGAKALELASNRSVDLILLDCQMPGLDGFEVARLLREDPGRYGQPIIVALTAHALSEERRRCLEVGMNDFLSKPLSFQNLREALEKWVSGQA